ncbi:putative response regulator [Treponema primitia ZAS-2]|uniref:Putative response regulator n=2 Tax=Treponema primitia TaxID=88058 RepID=F5YQH1_TREPZ|nr:putative response regulator [Treponema primitia ZAS-2]
MGAMKKTILIIDESPLFREYLVTKLAENELDLDVDTAGNSQEGVSKMRLGYPDLIILDYPLGEQTYMDVLKEKKLNPNTAKVPVIMVAQKIDQQKLFALVPYGVQKVFTKPIKVDILFKTLKDILGIKFEIDESPSIVDVHVNDNIIFVELAQGLNADKLDLLFFKVRELIELYEIKFLKIILMLHDLDLHGTEIHKLEKLLNLLLKVSKGKHKLLLILTNDDRVKKFIAGQAEYVVFNLVSSLQEATDALMGKEKPGPAAQEPAPAIATATVGEVEGLAGGDELELLEEAGDLDDLDDSLLAMENPKPGSMQFQFDMDARKRLSPEALTRAIKNLKIAAVDDEPIMQELIKNAFQSVGVPVKTFSRGAEFLKSPNINQYDLVFLDILMPEMDGFAVLQALQERNYQTPVVVLSALSKREMVVKAFQMGVKSYLIKPMNPEDIFKKTVEILKTTF